MIDTAAIMGMTTDEVEVVANHARTIAEYIGALRSVPISDDVIVELLEAQAAAWARATGN